MGNRGRRDLIRKLCLSIGLLQPGDSRDVIVDVLRVLLDSKAELSSDKIIGEVIKLRENANLPLVGIAPSNIRRQLKRLRELYIIEKVSNNYRITEFEELSRIFEQKIEKFFLPSIVERVKEYFNALK
jgi:DNA-binding transcriptional ArsR family regulator